jgi:Ca2+-binding RTX toxin-like protein
MKDGLAQTADDLDGDLGNDTIDGRGGTDRIRGGPGALAEAAACPAAFSCAAPRDECRPAERCTSVRGSGGRRGELAMLLQVA